jgi:uncharacterized protein
MLTLVALILLPLAIIGAQIACGATGAVANSLYKLSFIIPPLIYCRSNGISVGRQVFKWHNWRNELLVSLGLGALAAAIFVGVYAALGDRLLDKPAIVAKIEGQFSVTAGTVLLIAPFTIAVNSLIEEFFYRGFAFGQLAPRHERLGTFLPTVVFTIQHLLFIYHWVTPLPLALAIVGLTVFALALQAMYVKADSLVAPWLIHVCGDLAMMGIAVELIF